MISFKSQRPGDLQSPGRCPLILEIAHVILHGKF
jgi:hypothetical protein